ncbi:MAG: aspartate/glutamate racemase family protein [Peptoniphilaceae bacterium]|nr:aspartate/glutamate racemase family protein [Peptoniphilaceae bacterium]MDY6018172.1 aspartate/glutamate racemase family protein [Anaerococcus sp.]
MKVGVFAGTSVDTQLGVDLLKSRKIESLSFPMSVNPKEQTKMQYYSKEKLEEIFIKKARLGIKQGMDKIFIYCNSLSSAIDCEKIQKLLNIPLITPLDAYKNINPSYKNVAIFAANGISAYKVDKIILESRDDINTISIGNLSIVMAIERKDDPEKIIDDMNLKVLLSYLEGIKDPKYKIDAIVLACTHFPYLKNSLKRYTKLDIIDPADYMINKLLEID